MKNFLKLITSFLLFAGIFGYPQQHGESSATAEDDSDMLMEPDELPPPQYSVVRSESRVLPINRQFIPTYTPTRFSRGFVPMISPRSSYASVSRVENYEPQIVARDITQSPEVAEQNFFPSFFRTQTTANSHSKPYKTTSSSSSNAASIAGRYSASGRSQNNFDQSILGSGDFAVIRGGTFYPENEKNRYDDFFSSGFYNNGHGGRPSAQPLKTKKPAYYPEDPFEHFTDFADINTGNEAAFSHHNFAVIYTNKNSTKPHPSHKSPKNIFEQLQLLDLEKEQEKEKEDDKKPTKLSKFKTKLAKTKVVKKYKKKLGPKVIDSDYIDPLIATS